MFIDGKLAPLGKGAVVLDPQGRTLKLAQYLHPTLPPPPIEVSWITKLEKAEHLPMYLNNKIGDCVVAAAGHMDQQWNFYAGHPHRPKDTDILTGYEDVGGYAPGNPNSDNGTNMLAFLKYWRKTGLAGRKIAAFLAVDWKNDVEVRQALFLFGNLYLGVALPESVQGAAAWTVPDGGVYTSSGAVGSWGGHCVPIVAASPETYTCVTWGASLKMSHNFLKNYGEEAYAVLSEDWINAHGVSPNGFNFEQLKADLRQITK